MPFYHVRLINHVFDVRDGGKDYPSLDAAVQASLVAAADVMADLVEKKQLNSVIDARVEDGDHVVARHSVSLTVRELDSDAAL